MDCMTDIEIAQAADMWDVGRIADVAGVPHDMLIPYGRGRAKVDLSYDGGHEGRLVLVTAMTPTPAGEGKTTTTVGLADAFRRLGRTSAAALREPSLGPVFGVKGGAAGGGRAQVIPMEDINLHFTGDIHAVGAANNLLAAMLDNHVHHGNSLGVDLRRVFWRRCMDMNDRQLRNIVSGLGGRANGFPREDGFDITVASEVMAVLCLASGIGDLKERLSGIVVAGRHDGGFVTAADLKAHGAMAALLRDALMPNLVQTLEHTPVFMHGGPFANIAHGCNSVLATRMALSSADYAVTEAGFGADLGAEKFFDIKCRMSGLRPSCAVVVATVRALKYHGGVPKSALKGENVEAVRLGLPNLLRHVSNVRDIFGVPCVVALNRFPGDTGAEIAEVERACSECGVKAVLSEVWEKGGEGGIELAREVIRLCEGVPDFRFAYDLDRSLEEKINDIVVKVYHGAGARLLPLASRQAAELEAAGFGGLPVCMAKTQYSFSDDKGLIGAPDGFTVTVRELKVAAGAGFVVALTGDIMRMPGLPAVPAAETIDVSSDGRISGLF